uniref:BHLH domain-containing protein n=1 Tax=Cacopsylla melanoneura TaxID=428564 RepID=A0A8D8V5X9_9HEMI
MNNPIKKAKAGPPSRAPTCKYEKARRDRLNVIITQLSTFLPEQNPAKSLSKIDILEKIVHLITCLLDDKKKLTDNSSVDECLKKELKELKSTVFDLKSKIVTLNKILKEAKISVPQDLEVAQFNKNFTPHLRYSNPKKTLTSKSTQTDNEATCKQPKPCHNVKSNNKPQEKVNDDESVENLISFTNNLKAPLKEIQMNALHPPPPPPPPFLLFYFLFCVFFYTYTYFFSIFLNGNILDIYLLIFSFHYV